MGIPRLTQDLLPYLERCIITSQAKDEPGIRIAKFAIDGPSMVYNVYTRLAAYQSTVVSPVGLCDLPSYASLNAAIQSFLCDLESYGAEIKYIFFDGELPLAKRPIRLERLEKSRAQLQFQKLAHPILKFQYAEHCDRTRGVVGEALWHSRAPANVVSTNLAAPFIVPAAIEYLKHSKWASVVSVVPGEAEAFCALAARASDVAILTNDSDLVLFEAPSHNGGVVLLHSLSLNTRCNVTVLEAQCWRPRQIAAKLELSSLLGLGFERSKDSTASFAIIRQRSKGSPSKKDDGPAFEAFAAQFQSASTSMPEFSRFADLDSFDPRLAEFVSQLEHFASTTKTTPSDLLHVTLPILLEDPTRDSSWSYGRSLRHAAYCLLFLNKLGLKEKSLRNAETTSEQSVVESSRKGQRIAQDLLLLTSCDQPLSAANEHLNQLSQYLLQATPLDSLQETAITHILWALHTVVKQFLAKSKQSFYQNLVEQFLGLPNPLHERFQRPRTCLPVIDEADGWKLLHLNANVQAVLYSARMLKQTIEYLQKYHRNHRIGSDGQISKMARVLDLMPPIQDLFLDPIGIRWLMQQVPQEKMREMIRPIFEDAGWPLDDTTDVNKQGSAKAGTVTDRKPKRREKARSKDNDKQSAVAAKFRSTNPFDLLMQ